MSLRTFPSSGRQRKSRFRSARLGDPKTSKPSLKTIPFRKKNRRSDTSQAVFHQTRLFFHHDFNKKNAVMRCHFDQALHHNHLHLPIGQGLGSEETDGQNVVKHSKEIPRDKDELQSIPKQNQGSMIRNDEDAGRTMLKCRNFNHQNEIYSKWSVTRLLEKGGWLVSSLSFQAYFKRWRNMTWISVFIGQRIGSKTSDVETIIYVDAPFLLFCCHVRESQQKCPTLIFAVDQIFPK